MKKTTKQEDLFGERRFEHGGEVRIGKRKLDRPFSKKYPQLVVLRSSRAIGKWSFIYKTNGKRVQRLTNILARRYKVKILRYVNTGMALSILIQAPKKWNLQSFLRVLCGLLVMMITGAKNGKTPLPRKGMFWDRLAFTKILHWGYELKTALQNLSAERIKTLVVSRTSKHFTFHLTHFILRGLDPPQRV